MYVFCFLPLVNLTHEQCESIAPSGSLIALGGFSSAHNSALAVNEAEYYRRVQQFNQMHPSKLYGTRITSWSGPVSAEDVLDEAELQTARQAGFPRFGMPPTTHYPYQHQQQQQLGLGSLYPPWAMSAPGMRDGLSKSSRTDSSGEEERRRERKMPLRSKLKRYVLVFAVEL